MFGNIVDEMARITVEEVYNEDLYEEWGFYPTPEETEAERDAACYGQDDRVLCIEEGSDMTDCGQVIPEWAFG